jgi:hypothetical protein
MTERYRPRHLLAGGLFRPGSPDRRATSCPLRLDGPCLYRALQRHYAALLPRVIFVTGHADVEPYTTFLAQTGAPVLMKPFTRNELRLLIEWVLEP